MITDYELQEVLDTFGSGDDAEMTEEAAAFRKVARYIEAATCCENNKRLAFEDLKNAWWRIVSAEMGGVSDGIHDTDR